MPRTRSPHCFSLCRHCVVRYTSLLLFLLAAALLHALPAVYSSLLIGAVLFVLYGTMVLWYYGIMVLWYYGIMVLWFCLMCRYFRAYSLTLERRVFQFQYILKQMAYDTCHWCIALYLAYLLAQVCAGFQTNPPPQVEALKHSEVTGGISVTCMRYMWSGQQRHKYSDGFIEEWPAGQCGVAD